MIRVCWITREYSSLLWCFCGVYVMSPKTNRAGDPHRPSHSVVIWEAKHVLSMDAARMADHTEVKQWEWQSTPLIITCNPPGILFVAPVTSLSQPPSPEMLYLKSHGSVIMAVFSVPGDRHASCWRVYSIICIYIYIYHKQIYHIYKSYIYIIYIYIYYNIYKYIIWYNIYIYIYLKIYIYI